MSRITHSSPIRRFLGRAVAADLAPAARFRNRTKPGFEELENRTTPAAVVWDGGGGNSLWATAANWSGDVLPGPNDDVTINVPGTLSVQLSADTVVRSLQCAENLTITSANFTVTAGSSLVSGAFNLTGVALSADGPTAHFTASGPSTIASSLLSGYNQAQLDLPGVSGTLTGVTLYAFGGSQLHLPNVTQYLKDYGDHYVQATGSGSLIDLSHVVSVKSNNDGGALYVQAQSGGTINLNHVTEFTDGYIRLESSGAGSLLDLSLLPAITGNGWSGGYLQATGGAELRAPLLTQLNQIGLSLGSGGVMSVSQITTITNANISVDGNQNVSLPGLAGTLTGVSLYAYGGGQLHFPNVTQYLKDNADRTIQSYSEGSLIDLSHVVSVKSNNNGGVLYVQARNGGTINLDHVTEFTDGYMRLESSGVSVLGTGSLLDLSLLTAITANGWSGGYLQATGGAELRAPLLTALNQIGLYLGSGGLMSVSQIATITNANITVDGNQIVQLPALTGTMSSVSLYAYSGGQLHLPGITQYLKDNTDRVIESYGQFSLINLANVVSIKSNENGGILYIQADAGGRINLSHLTELTDGYLRLSAAGVDSAGIGSLLDVSLLPAVTANGWSGGYLQATGGAELRAPLLTALTKIGLYLGSGGVMSVSQITSITNANITVDGGQSVSLPGLTGTLTGVSLSAYSGGQLHLPGITQYRKDNTDRTFESYGLGSVIDLANVVSMKSNENGGVLYVQADGGGRIDLSHLTELTDGYMRLSADSTDGAANGSLIDLSVLTHITANGWNGGYLQATSGAEIRVPLLTTLNGIGLYVGGNSILSVGQITGITNSTIQATSGANLTFTGLSGILAGVSLYAYYGAAIHFPSVTQVLKDSTGRSIQAYGEHAVVDLSHVTSVKSNANGAYLDVQAYSGGFVNLNHVTEFTDGYMLLISSGVDSMAIGSLIDISMLTAITVNGSGSGYLQAIGGAELRAPLLAAVTGLDLYSTGSGKMVLASTVVSNAAVHVELDSNYVGITHLTLSATGSLFGQGNFPVQVTNAGGLYPSGQLTISGLVSQSAPSLRVFLRSATDYDRIKVNGAVDLTGTALVLLPAYSPVNGDSFTLIDNDGTDSVVGTFTGLPDGSEIVVSGHTFRINYHAGTGNDVVLADFHDTATTLGAGAPNPSTGGSSVSFPVTVAGGVPNGSIVYLKDASDGDTIVSTNTLVSGAASFNISSLVVGDHLLYASYDGSAFFAASQSSAVLQTVTGFATTTTLVETGANPSAIDQAVGFTVTVSGGAATSGQVVKLRDASNGNVVVATGVLSGGSASLVVPANALSAGSHSLFAAYSATVFNAASTSTPAIVQVVIPHPRVVSVTPNGNIPAMVGTQHSNVVSLVVTFDQPVLLDANAMSLALHTNNVAFNGVAYPNGYGTLPTLLNVSTIDHISWVVTFTGNTDPAPPLFGAPANGKNSLKDGVYDLNVDATKVHSQARPDIGGAANAPYVFHRLFGDETAPDVLGGIIYTATVNTTDNFDFRTSFNNPGSYLVYFDFDGDGQINTTDNLQFRTRFNSPLTWRV